MKRSPRTTGPSHRAPTPAGGKPAAQALLAPRWPDLSGPARDEPRQRLGQALVEMAGLMKLDSERGLIASDWAQDDEQAAGALRELFQTRCFERRSPPDPRPTRYSERASGDPALVGALNAALGSATYSEPGWHLAKAAGKWGFVSNQRLCLFVEDRAQLAPADAEEGQPVQVKLPCARENLFPGYFHLVSRAGPVDRRAPHLEIFLNLSAEGGPPLLEALFARSKVSGLRFEGQLVNSPGGYGRVETGHLWVDSQSYPPLVALLLRFAEANGHWLREGAPLFTRSLTRGVAVAEAPWGEEAAPFALHRCRLVARGILAALVAREPPGEAWLSRVEAQFTRAGLSLDRPHLGEVIPARGPRGRAPSG